VKTCKTCKHWTAPGERTSWNEECMCRPLDLDTGAPMQRGFEVRLCKQPSQTFCEAPVERNGFGLTDGSSYLAALATAEDFGCVRHEDAIRPSTPCPCGNPACKYDAERHSGMY
jgi:hypothetical protein